MDGLKWISYASTTESRQKDLVENRTKLLNYQK
jgi:hypothetical protein